MHRKLKYFLIALLFIQIFGMRLFSFIPEKVEKYYSMGFFVTVSQFLRQNFGSFAFSVGDLFYLTFFILLIYYFIIGYKKIIAQPGIFALNILTGVSIIYLIFNILWGLNYYRVSLNKTLGLDTSYKTEDLYSVTKLLIEKSNQTHYLLTKRDSSIAAINLSKNNILEMAPDGYKNLAKQYPSLQYHNPSLKASLWSLGLSYMGFSGYYNPFTAEAQSNEKVLEHDFIVTSCHEIAHQIGYAAENEANFIGFLSAISNENIYFKYAGYLFALRYCLSELKQRDSEKFDTLINTVDYGILLRYKNSNKFWIQYKNPFDKIFESIFDSFLKANSQSMGIKSYNQVVGLLVNYYAAKN